MRYLSVCSGIEAALHLTTAERQAWAEVDMAGEVVEEIARSGGYAKVRLDGRALLRLQDALDHAMHERCYKVVDGLTTAGWKMQAVKSNFEKEAEGRTYRASMVFSHVGPSKNVVGFKYEVRDITKPEYELVEVVDNSMDEPAKRMVSRIDMAAIDHARQVTAVKAGRYIGEILDVAGKVVTQKVGRDGTTVTHDAARLSAPVTVGRVVDIQYQGDKGQVQELVKDGQER